MKRYRGFEFRRGVETFAHKAASALSLSMRLRIIWDDDITTAGVTSNGQMYLADVNDDEMLTHRDLTKYCGFVLHELCHVAYTNFSVKGSGDYLRALHNAVEDAFIEHCAIDRKLMGNVEEVFTTLIDTMVDNAMKSVSDWSDPRQYPFVLAVYLRKHASNKAPLANGLKPIFDVAADRLKDAKTTSDTLEIAEWIEKQLQSISNPQQQKKSKPKKSDKPSGDNADQDGDAADDSPSPAGDAKAPGKDCDPAEVEPQLKSSRIRGGSYSPDLYTTPIRMHQRHSNGFDLSNGVPGKLRYNLKRLFDNSDYSDFQHNRKFGSVNVNALAQHQYNSNVFKLRREIDGIDSAVVICLDVSDSMFGDEPNERRAKMAAQCTAALTETLRHAQVSTCILTFGSRIAVLKDWNDSIGQTRQRLSLIDHGGSTNDYQCVRYAHQLLLNRHEKRKLCIVITDGDGWGDAVGDQIKVGTRLGVTTLGIGISLDVSRTYDQHINVDDVADLGVATFKNIKLAA